MTAAKRTLTTVNRLDEIERLGRALEGFGAEHGLPPRVVFDSNLALDEVLTNIVSYAYDDDATHEIAVRLRIEDDRLVIEVEDDGRPFDPLAAPEPDLALHAGERPVGGLGLSLVRRLMPELRYERRAGRNVLTMSRSVADPVRETTSQPSLNVTELRSGSVVVLRADGRLDAAGAVVFEQEMLGRVAAGARRIVVDCSKLDYINSAGLRVLLIAAKRLAADSGALALAAATGQIRSVLEIVGFDSVFPVCGTVDEARIAVSR